MTSPLPDAAVGKLTPTATYEARDYNWARAPQLSLGSVPIEGLLALRMKPFTGRQELDVYAVLYEGEQPFEGHAFLLFNVYDPDQPDVYRVCVGAKITCSCKAGVTNPGRGCKHAHSLEALLYREHHGGLPMAKDAKTPAIKPSLGDVLLLKRDGQRVEADGTDRRLRWVVVEIVTRTRMDGEFVEYVTKSSEHGCEYTAIVSGVEIAGLAY